MKLLPSLKQLEYLVALAETQHFNKAAERCNVTSSTLSAGIKDLEDVLDVFLAERNKRHVIITPIGNEIALLAKKLLCDAENIMNLAMANRKPMTGDIRLGVIPTIGPFLLPRVLPILQKQYPALRLFLDEDLTDHLLNKLYLGEIDLVLLALPYDTKGFVCKTLFTDEFIFACEQQHPLAQKKEISMADLYQQPLMLLEEGHCLRAHVLEVCKLAQNQRRNKLEASSFYTLVQMVASGIGVTLLPKLAIETNIIRDTNICLVPLATPTSRQIGLVWRYNSPREYEFELLSTIMGNTTVKASIT